VLPRVQTLIKAFDVTNLKNLHEKFGVAQLEGFENFTEQQGLPINVAMSY
jgi:hypothetical protein